MKILTIGSAMYDLFLEHAAPQSITLTIDGEDVNYIVLEEGCKIELSDIIPFIGGGALNAACSFAQLGFSATVCAKVGNDAYGKFILAQLQKKKIDTVFITTSSEKTGSSYIIPSHSGNRAILVYRGANLTLDKKNIPFDMFDQFDQLYITSLSCDTSELLPMICKHAKKLGISVAANPGTSQLTANTKTLIDSLDAINVLILNCLEASLLMEQFGYSSPIAKKYKNLSKNKLPDLLSAPIVRGSTQFMLQDYFNEIHSRGPRLAVVTNGADGVYVSDGTMIYYHPSLPIAITSTVGAGDAFGSTFIAQLLKKKPIEDAIRAAVINSAAILEHIGATTGLLDQKELDELVADIDKNGIKKFTLDK
jgi:sugar/nucleoside kinase (ribokinase family)